jgi:hypothetical protein
MLCVSRAFLLSRTRLGSETRRIMEPTGSLRNDKPDVQGRAAHSARKVTAGSIRAARRAGQ